MTAPVRFCLCAHKASDHDRGKGPCSRAVCSCGKFRESPVPTTAPTLEFRPGPSTAGYQAHRRNGTPPCDDCRKENAAYFRMWRQRRPGSEEAASA